jgi:hypothetical protein
LVKVYSAVNILEAELVRSLLKKNEIESILIDKNMTTIYGTSIPFGGIKIMVNRSDAGKAKEIICSVEK